MDNFKSFQSILQSSVEPDQDSWSYVCPNLPRSQQTNSSGFIKHVSISATETKQHILLRYERSPNNRMTRTEPLNKLLLLSFADLHLRWPGLEHSDPSRPATTKEHGDYITRILIGGIKLNSVQYNFFGHSNSQLKSRSCFMYAASKAEIASKIEAMGNFTQLKSVAKKAKRIGLLFSSADIALVLSPERCEDIEDIERDSYVFTDGCGLIALQLARQLAQRRNIIFRDKRYLPSVFQIRYRGYKGVLTVDNTLQGQVQVQFRNSMRKFKDASDHSFAVVDYSKPYAFGNLNDEIVVLLHTLGIGEDVLLRKQRDHLEFIGNVRHGDARAAFQFLSFCDRFDLAEKLLLEGIQSVQSSLEGLVKAEYAKMLNKYNEQRCRILIPMSRLLFGVCDPSSKNNSTGSLKEGECFVRITDHSTGTARAIINTEVLVTRNPCLYPGDLQKFRAVDVPGFEHLVDCIVFSTNGRRPGADLMSGGDLDGDKFFVTWDPDIIPNTMAEPAKYPGGKEFVTFGEVNGDTRAEYFARYTNASLGRIKNLYMKWARISNAMSPECQQLNRLFSQCVDGNFIRIPENLKEFLKLEDPPEPVQATAPFILDTLHAASTDFIHQSVKIRPEISDSADIMDLCMSRDKIAMSEFELLQLLLTWCERRGSDTAEYIHLIDFSTLTDEQRIWTLGRIPPSVALPSLVRNGLLQSDLISPEEFQRFSLDRAQLHWKPIFKSSTDRMGRFLTSLCRSSELFHKKLVVLSVDERLSVAIYIPTKIARATEVQVDSSVRVFTFPHSQGFHSSDYVARPTKSNYRLYCDEHVFQLYERHRANTWIFLRGSHGDDSFYRNEKSKGDRRRKREQTIENRSNFDCKASIALDKVSKSVQRHVGKVQQNGVLNAEIYAISNRDVQSMQFLDQWLTYIDTDQVLPLFETQEVDYKIPKLQNTDWSGYSAPVVAVVRDSDFTNLRNLHCVDDLRVIFGLLNTYDEKEYLHRTVSEVLDLIGGSSSFRLDTKLTASILLQYLPEAVYLVAPFLQSRAWEIHKPALQEILDDIGPIICRHLVLAWRSLGHLVRYPFVLILRELKRISFQHFANLVELIALAINSTEFALDLLLGVLEPEVSRLLVGRPTEVRQFTSSLFGIALDYIEEASSPPKVKRDTLKLSTKGFDEGYTVTQSTIRVDSDLCGQLKTGDHVLLVVSNPPQNAPLTKAYSMDAIVIAFDTGSVTFRCLHEPPSYVRECAWNITLRGSFVTSKTLIDAVTLFYSQRDVCCKIYDQILGKPHKEQAKLMDVGLPNERDSSLNESQNDALAASMKFALTFIWGPPGTGKTHTITVILTNLLVALPESRFLVTAPTHNAVDNLLRRFINDKKTKKCGVIPVRVSTQLAKVATDLRSYTCDAMLGKDLTANVAARRKAQKRIKDARLVFTTCAGAALGLLRTEIFDVVIIDEASQQTEPATLVPLVKGCSRALLVGDHVQLRATVQQTAVLTGYNVSLFERHFNLPSRIGVAKVMLDTQYRMHRDVCAFSAAEFYNDKLNTAVKDSSRPLPASLFPWPLQNRTIWVECAGNEDLGSRSKANFGQVELCKRVIQLLRTSPSTTARSSDSASSLTCDSEPSASIAILTPYTRQKDALALAISGTEVSSIDGFQGREADIVVFVTVRSNSHYDMGFLADMRRLNVVMTRAKTATIVIGNKNTLAGVGCQPIEVDESRNVWRRLIQKCAVVELPETIATM